MERERWQLVEQLYHSALDRDERERAAFLEQACHDDESLRREVDSLLAVQEKAATFIESPALEVAAQLLTKEEVEQGGPTPLPAGTTISHYQVIEKIGAGGMGEVYRAHDPRLGRDVAIKILPQGFMPSDPARLRRFEQEARAAAALNHPNIVAIYDVGTWEYGTPYVVSELLEGETLRACLGRGPLPASKAINLASDIALGLAAAHDKGIVHRDLKPENLFLTKDGQLKILDFGLAKLLPENVLAPELASVTQSTSSPKIMGTLGYMSPEQVRAQTVDQRTDIFSLGAVIYEMLSGQRAFKGATPADTISAILSQDPPELTTNAQSIPPGLNGIVRRSLEKNPNDRFHSARDVAFALAAISERPASEVKSPAGQMPVFRWKAAVAAGAFVFSAILLWIWNPGDIRHVVALRGGSAQIRSLAVLPLENVSGQADQEYFADGMTDELITELARLGDVRVISRTSVMPFKATHKSLSEIASALHVDAVVEGSVLRDGTRVRITAQLVEAPTDRHLWAQSYEGNVADVIRLQNEVARSVADEIKATLRPDQKTRLNITPRAIVPEAYDLYLQGLYTSANLTPENLQKSFDYFNQAIQKDPTFAPSYAGLAEAYAWAAGLSILPSPTAFEKAEVAAKRALELDPNLGMAHHSLAWVKYARYWDLSGAEREFQRAIDLSPNNATAHLWYGMYLAQQQHSDESFVEMRRARELDPFSSIVTSLAMTPLLTSHQYDTLIEQTTSMLKSNPSNGVLNWLLSSAYEQKGDIARAIDAQEKQAILYGEDRQHAEQEFAALRREFAAQGERAYWLSRQKSLSSSPTTDPFDLSVVQARLGESDGMLDSLEKALQQRSASLLYWIKVEPAYDRYRGDPRFQDFIRRTGLSR
jgi:serine/threonine protein kinase/TolB-like protein